MSRFPPAIIDYTCNFIPRLTHELKLTIKDKELTAKEERRKKNAARFQQSRNLRRPRLTRDLFQPGIKLWTKAKATTILRSRQSNKHRKQQCKLLKLLCRPTVETAAAIFLCQKWLCDGKREGTNVDSCELRIVRKEKCKSMTHNSNIPTNQNIEGESHKC